MIKNILIPAAVAALLAIPSEASAWDLRDLLGGKSSSQSSETQQQDNSSAAQGILGLIDGLLSNSDFDLKQLEGTWKVTGSAVAFKGEDALSQIGGKAATVAVEKKLDPYYKKYGLTGSEITFDKEGNFTLKIKKLTINGTVEKTGESSFQTTFKTFGSTTLAPMNTYFERGATGSTLSVMWDAKKAFSLIQGVAAFVKSPTSSALSSLLDKYENVYAGFRLNRVK